MTDTKTQTTDTPMITARRKIISANIGKASWPVMSVVTGPTGTVKDGRNGPAK